MSGNPHRPTVHRAGPSVAIPWPCHSIFMITGGGGAQSCRSNGGAGGLDIALLNAADILCTTPEKWAWGAPPVPSPTLEGGRIPPPPTGGPPWVLRGAPPTDGISRNWQNRGYVRDVALLVIDEIHLLGNDRGPPRRRGEVSVPFLFHDRLEFEGFD